MSKVNPTATLGVRLKVRLGLVEKSCASCAVFDRDAGQRFIQTANPAFARATNHLSPGQMLSAKREDVDAEGQPVEPKDLPFVMGWDQFGICPVYKVATHEGYWCGGPYKGKDEKDAWK